MQVGLVNMNPNSKPTTFVETLHSMHCNVELLDSTELSKEDIFKTIQQSPCKKWIFTGSSANIYDANAPSIRIDILNTDKEYFLICYSMEYILHTLGYPVIRRSIGKKETFVLSHTLPNLKNPANLYRNHHYFIPSNRIQCLAEYDGEAMVYTYKNAIMTQFHPEKTDDGKQMLFSWIMG